jgi:hypothetical protein
MDAGIAQLVAEAQSDGDIREGEDPAQLAFELNSMLGAANATYVMFADPTVLDRARVGLRQRLLLAAPTSAAS